MTDILNIQLDEHTIHPVDIQRFREKTSDTTELKSYIREYIKDLQRLFHSDSLIQSILKGDYHTSEEINDADFFLQSA